MRMAQELHCDLCVWKELSHLVWHMSHPWLFSHAPSSMSTSSSYSPTCPPSQREHSAHPAHLQVPSVDKLRHQESLAWRLAECRKPTHDNSHRLWAQRACDCLKDRRLFWRSKSTIWCTWKSWRRRSTSSNPWRRWRHLERLGRLVCQVPTYQRCPTSNRRCISTIPWKAL